jgi:hydroxymethylpyrimidine/phosphomethylpyrimidine kinase
MQARVLVVAGSDSGGGAGAQADLKTVLALGGYAMTALTAITAQSTRGVFGVWPVPLEAVVAQLEVTLDDLGADVVKTGMLHDAELVAAVADVLARRAAAVPLVVDPVLVAKGGARLLERSAERAVLERLVPRAALVTPNAPELEALTGEQVGDEASLLDAARALVALGAPAVLAKGGHVGTGERVVDWLCARAGGGALLERRFEGPRVATRSTHGTGCTLASAVATSLAQGLPLEAAIERARAYVLEAIRAAPGLGSGHGPLGHGHTVRSFP